MNAPASSDFLPEVSSKLEPLLIKHVCEPILARIPPGVRPNTISLLNHLVCWLTATCAYLSTRLSPLGRMFALFGAGVGTFSLAVGDSLDGMQARKTGQCSKLGEMMDHWLDAIHQPMVTFGVALALELGPWEAALLHITSTMIYNVQLLLYHRTGRFVHTKTSGCDAQVGTTVGYMVFGVFFYFFDHDLVWVGYLITALVTLAVVKQLSLTLFYYKELGRDTLHHLPFLLLCAVFTALHILGALGPVTFLLGIVLLSFRISGSYVLYSIVGRSYQGFDGGVALLLAAALASHFIGGAPWLGPLSPAASLTWLTMTYMVARNLWDFTRHFRQLAPAPTTH